MPIYAREDIDLGSTGVGGTEGLSIVFFERIVFLRVRHLGSGKDNS